MYMTAPDKEVTQVEFWTNYKEIFTPFQDRQPLLVASDVIKNVGSVYAQAQAMVLPGPPQRFVIRGISRSQTEVAEGYYKCQWDRGTCESTNFTNPDELNEHLKSIHLEPLTSAEPPGDFTCSSGDLPALRRDDRHAASARLDTYPTSLGAARRSRAHPEGGVCERDGAAPDAHAHCASNAAPRRTRASRTLRPKATRLRTR